MWYCKNLQDVREQKANLQLETVRESLCQMQWRVSKMKSYTLPIPALLTRHPPSTHILFRGNLKTDSLSHIWKILNNLGQNLTHFITTNCNFSLCDSSSQSCNYIYIIFNLQHLKLKEDNGSKILFISFFFCQTHILLWSCCWQHHVEMSFNCLWVLIQKYFLILCSFLEAGDKTYTSHLIVSLCMFPWFILIYILNI